MHPYVELHKPGGMFNCGSTRLQVVPRPEGEKLKVHLNIDGVSLSAHCILDPSSRASGDISAVFVPTDSLFVPTVGAISENEAVHCPDLRVW